MIFQKCIIRFYIEIQWVEPCKGDPLLRKAEHDNIQSELITCGRTLTTIRAIKTSRHPFIAFFEFQKHEWKTYYCEKQVKFEEAVLFLLFLCRLSCWLRFNIYSYDMSQQNDSILISSCRGSMIGGTRSPGGSPERVTGLHCNLWAASQLNNAVLCYICCPSNLLWSC